jgi:hypothetical protein
MNSPRVNHGFDLNLQALDGLLPPSKKDEE